MTQQPQQIDGSSSGLSRRALLAVAGAAGVASLPGNTAGDVNAANSDAVPIRNWQIGPIADLPPDADGVEGDVYFPTDQGEADRWHDGSSWNKLPVAADNAEFGSVSTEDADIESIYTIVDGDTKFLNASQDEIDTWEDNHAPPWNENSNRFHALRDTPETFSAELENLDGAVNFYIEAGENEWAAMGYQEGSTNLWFHGYNTGDDGPNGDPLFLLDPTDDGTVNASESVFMVDSGGPASVGLAGAEPVSDLGLRVLNTNQGEPPDLHRSAGGVHDGLSVEGDGDTFLRVAGDNGGSVGSGIFLTNRQVSADNRHWTVQNKADDNRLSISYVTTSSSSDNQATGGTEHLTVDTNGHLSLPQSGSGASPAVEIGGSGAGLYVNGSGELVGVDEGGNETVLT